MPYKTDPLFSSTPQAPTAVIPVTTSGAPYGGPYVKAVLLTPGTPVAAGRGCIVKGSGSFGLKLQGGGTVMVGDVSGGAGTRHDGYAVIDAVLSNPADSIQILY